MLNSNYKIQPVNNSEHEELITIWESSVKATHHFLQTADFFLYKKMMPEFLQQVNLICAKDKDGTIVGFLGFSGQYLEMLFVHADYRGSGIGKLLLNYCLHHHKLTKVDVNEENRDALAFYEHFSFKIISRSEVDGMGKPYPILHLSL